MYGCLSSGSGFGMLAPNVRVVGGKGTRCNPILGSVNTKEMFIMYPYLSLTA